MFKTFIPPIICISIMWGCAESTPITPGVVGVLDQEVTDTPRDQGPMGSDVVPDRALDPAPDMTPDMVPDMLSDMSPSRPDAELDQQVDMSSEDMLSEDMSSERDIGPPDEDRDGYPADIDCDDQDSLINPGASERCNSLDDDCDQNIDEEVTIPVWFRDQDGDSFGDEAESVEACEAPMGYVERSGDCAPGDPSINPDVPEVCDGVDQDCVEGADNGVITDGAGCQDPGPPAVGAQSPSADLTIRNGNNAGDDGSLVLRFESQGFTRSFPLNNVGWNDHMRNTVDVFHVDLTNTGLSDELLRGALTTVEYDDTDAWALSCVQLNISGVSVYCNQYPSDVTLDADDDTTQSFSLPNPLPSESLPCSCYDHYLSHGPVIGATSSSSTRIWGRTDATRQVILKMGQDPANLQVVGYRYPLPEQDYTFTFDVSGLLPSTTYHYAIEIAGQTQTDTFKTAPAQGEAGVYRIALGSCAKTVPDRHPEQRIFAAIDQANPDLMLMLGDNVYLDALSNGDASDLGAMRSFYRDSIARQGSWGPRYYPPLSVYDPEDPSVRPSYTERARWWGSFGRDARADLFASTPVLAIWDDHDFYYNNADSFYDDRRERKPWTFEVLKLFNEYWPNPPGGQSDSLSTQMGIYFKQSWGDIDIFGLDTRFHRDATREVMLGRAQMDWIKRELSASQATFKFILSGSIFGGPSDDREKWPHFEADRAELFNYIWNSNIEGVVLMSGDVHFSGVLTHQSPNRPNRYQIYEVISSGLANYGPSGSSAPNHYGSVVQLRYFLPGQYDRRLTNAFATVDVDSSAADPTLAINFFNEEGGTICLNCPFELRASELRNTPE